MDGDPEYFSSYEDLEIHRLMLEDSARTLAYKKAILDNKAYFNGKVVMDVGCGTGILSIFAAQAGARKVYAVEASELANLAKDIVKENNYDNVIEVIHSKVEEVTLPNNEKVDAIISEWMGFYLLHEGMLDSVLAARDRFLKEGGEMFPESAAIYVSPCSLPSLHSKWDNLYGVSMSNFAKHLRSNKCNKPEILNVQPEDLLGQDVAFGWVNLREDTVADLNSFSIQHVVGASKDGNYEGLCVWFECNFPHLDKERERVVLGTGPQHEPTHWRQTVVVLPQSVPVEEGEPIAFQLDMNRDNVHCRRYNLQVILLDPEAVDHPLPCSCHMTKCLLVKAFMSQHPHERETVLQDEELSDDG